jgi:hypothetical protein
MFALITRAPALASWTRPLSTSRSSTRTEPPPDSSLNGDGACPNRLSDLAFVNAGPARPPAEPVPRRRLANPEGTDTADLSDEQPLPDPIDLSETRPARPCDCRRPLADDGTCARCGHDLPDSGYSRKANVACA